MPRMTDTDDSMKNISIPGPGTFTFSGIRPEKLGATEYTLVTIVVDETGSVMDFADELLETVKSIVKACAKHPRADNVLLRVLSFNDQVKEIHGFRQLININADDYDPFEPAGMTALYDATYSAVGGTLTYAKMLTDQDFDVNAAVYIITDGMDNQSTVSPKMISEKVRLAQIGEEIESMVSVLIGLNEPNGRQGYNVSQYLKDFKDDAQLTQYIDAGHAEPKTLARLANFVSQSISSQSQALGSGQASQQLTF